MDRLKPDVIVNVCRCENWEELERKLHLQFDDVRLPQSEHFTLSKSQARKAQKLLFSLAEGGYSSSK